MKRSDVPFVVDGSNYELQYTYMEKEDQDFKSCLDGVKEEMKDTVVCEHNRTPLMKRFRIKKRLGVGSLHIAGVNIYASGE